MAVQYQPIPVRFPWILAIALGVLAGIYLASCGEDNHPEASTITCLNVVVTRLPVAGDDMNFYRLGMGPHGGSGLLSIDSDVPLSRYFAEHSRLQLCMEPR